MYCDVYDDSLKRGREGGREGEKGDSAEANATHARRII